MDKIKENLTGIGYLLMAIAVFVIITIIFQWLMSPIEIIYNPDAPSFPCSMGGCKN
jgi:hypothetical protein